MKYSKFKRDVEAMGLSTTTVNGCVEVLDKYGEMLLYVDTEYDFSISTEYTSFDELDQEIKKKLFNLAVELASTPLDEREDEKRYRLVIPFVNDNVNYLNKEKQTSKLFVYTKHETWRYQTIFTESEIAELKAKHNLDSFVLEEVENDE